MICRVNWCVAEAAKGCYGCCRQHADHPVLHSLEQADQYWYRICRSLAPEPKADVEQAALIGKDVEPERGVSLPGGRLS